MKALRTLTSVATLAAAALFAAPASAQFFYQPPDLRGAPVTGTEPGVIAQSLPGATPDELKAAMLWNLRAALNVAALQCDFSPMLLTRPNYNKIVNDHATELKIGYDTLTNYFKRTAATPKAGQTALDQYGTRVYSSFSTVGAQLTFCMTASEVANLAVFTPRGSLTTLAAERLRQLRNSLVLAGEQRFPRGFHVPAWTAPSMDPKCWKNENWLVKKCGVQRFG